VIDTSLPNTIYQGAWITVPAAATAGNSDSLAKSSWSYSTGGARNAAGSRSLSYSRPLRLPPCRCRFTLLSSFWPRRGVSMSATQSCTKFNGYLLTGPSATRPRTTILRDSSVFTPCLQFRQQISGNPVNVGNVVNVSANQSSDLLGSRKKLNEL